MIDHTDFFALSMTKSLTNLSILKAFYEHLTVPGKQQANC